MISLEKGKFIPLGTCFCMSNLLPNLNKKNAPPKSIRFQKTLHAILEFGTKQVLDKQMNSFYFGKQEILCDFYNMTKLKIFTEAFQLL